MRVKRQPTVIAVLILEDFVNISDGWRMAVRCSPDIYGDRIAKIIIPTATVGMMKELAIYALKQHFKVKTDRELKKVCPQAFPESRAERIKKQRALERKLGIPMLMKVPKKRGEWIKPEPDTVPRKTSTTRTRKSKRRTN